MDAKIVDSDSTSDLTALVHAEPGGGYWGEIPSLPGCYTQGETLDEILTNLQEAARCWIEAAAQRPEFEREVRITTLRLAA